MSVKPIIYKTVFWNFRCCLKSVTEEIIVSVIHYDITLHYCLIENTGPVGVAAAAAIVSAKKRKRPHSFETNPSIRKRQQNRLLRKLRVSDKGKH